MVSDFSKVYKGKKVFLTGHTGFKGSWLLSWLHDLGAEVHGYALAPKNDNDLYHLIDGDSLCTSHIGDIRDLPLLQNAIVSFQPDFVFHLAAQPLVRLSYETPVDTFNINTMGTANLLDAIRELNKPCIAVIITTDKVYENKELNYYYKEEDRLGGYDPYSASKATAEIVIDSYRKSFFNISRYEEHRKSISVARAGNVIGGGDWSKDRLIPDIVKALHAGTDITIRNPHSIRPWQHVLEPLSGYLALGSKQCIDPVSFSTAFNFGPETSDNLTVEEIVKESISEWGTGNYVVLEDNSSHEANLLQLDIGKAKNNLGWYPRYSAKKAVQLTLNWYKQYYSDPASAKKITFEQLNSYMEL